MNDTNTDQDWERDFRTIYRRSIDDQIGDAFSEWVAADGVKFGATLKNHVFGFLNLMLDLLAVKCESPELAKRMEEIRREMTTKYIVALTDEKIDSMFRDFQSVDGNRRVNGMIDVAGRYCLEQCKFKCGGQCMKDFGHPPGYHFCSLCNRQW